MNLYVLKMLVVSLALTILLEWWVAGKLWKPMTRDKRKLVALVNVLTNPAAVFINWVLGLVIPAGDLLVQVPIEAVVILVETLVYKQFATEERWGLQRPVKLAVVTNLVSWLAGVVLQIFV